MAHLYVGTSGWAYPTWKPAFYPEKLAQKKFLNFYASKLNAVEVNYTFRQLVKETTVQNWCSPSFWDAQTRAAIGRTTTMERKMIRLQQSGGDFGEIF